MKRKSRRKPRISTAPDHRPMPPELRGPSDPLDAALKEARRSDPLIEPREYTNWR